LRANVLRAAALLSPCPSHHSPSSRKQDGSGYPDGLKGDQIPLTARILQVTDIYDALSTDRPYRKALPAEKAFAIMRDEVKRGWWMVLSWLSLRPSSIRLIATRWFDAQMTPNVRAHTRWLRQKRLIILGFVAAASLLLLVGWDSYRDTLRVAEAAAAQKTQLRGWRLAFPIRCPARRRRNWAARFPPDRR